MIVGFCNPLIDATVEVEPEYLTKWNLKNDDAILADSSYQPLIDDTISNSLLMTSGGALQNTLVMAQWMMQSSGRTAIVGAVGNDKNKAVLENIMSKCGVEHLYQVIDGQFTGCSAILLCRGNRSIVASVAASSCFDFEHWDTPAVMRALDEAKVVVISTFFLRSSDRTGLAVAAECAARGIPLAISLSSPTAIDSEAWPALRALFRVSSIVFGNETEILCMGKKLGIVAQSVAPADADTRAITEALANYGSPAVKRTVVATMGRKPTIACATGAAPIERPVVEVDPAKFVDTNAAGDSFAAGFLAHFIRGAQLARCVDAGNYCASCCIQEHGCTVPQYPPAFD